VIDKMSVVQGWILLVFLYLSKLSKKKEIMNENYKLFYYLIQKVFFFLRKVLFKKLGFFYVFVVETLA
jgi:hypothetical protein